MEGKKIIWKYGLTCTGVKRGKRKAQTYTERNLKTFEGTPSKTEAMKVAWYWLELNMKSYDNVTVTARLYTVEGEIETYEPFNDSHNLMWKV